MADISTEELERIEQEFHSGPGTIKTTKEFAKPEDLYKDLIASIRKYHPSTDISLIEKAYKVAYQAHEGQVRKSGEAYIIHPLSSVYHSNYPEFIIRLRFPYVKHRSAKECGFPPNFLPTIKVICRNARHITGFLCNVSCVLSFISANPLYSFSGLKSRIRFHVGSAFPL